MWIVYTAIFGYFLGSIPCGFLLGKLKGVDIRQHGSKNIGATNALRVLGKPMGYTTFALDVFKGVLSVWLVKLYFSPTPETSTASIVAAIFCILGHNFPVWLKFKGGKGISTSAGVLIGLMPWAVLVISIVWVIVLFSTGYASLASLSASACLPVTVFALLMTHVLDDWLLFVFGVVAAALAFWRHRANIERLMKGTEPKFRGKKKA